MTRTNCDSTFVIDSKKLFISDLSEEKEFSRFKTILNFKVLKRDFFVLKELATQKLLVDFERNGCYSRQKKSSAVNSVLPTNGTKIDEKKIKNNKFE